MEGHVPLSSITKLNDTNYQLWRHQVQIILKAKRVWNVVENVKPELTENVIGQEREQILNDIQKYEEKSAVAAAILLSTLEPSQGHQVINLDEARDIWHKLKQIHEGKVSSRRVDLRLELSSIKKGETEKLEQYLARAQYIRDQLSQCGAHIENEEYMGLILHGLPRAYNVIRLQMKATGLEKITEAEFRTGLKAQEEEIAIADIETKMEATYLSKTQQKYSDEKKSKPDINCYVCGKRGHYARNCYRRADTRVRGHPRQQKEGQSSSSEQDEQRERSKKAEEKANTTKETPDNRAMRVTNKMGVQQTKWFIDSGATSHMTYNKRNFSEFEEANTNPVILPNGKTLQVYGKGTVKIKNTNNDCKYKNIDILNVLYVPELTENLISVSTFEKKGYITVFENGICKVTEKDGTLMLKGTRIDGLYEMDVTQGDTVLQAKHKAQEENANLWHRRLGHQNMQTINKMRTQGVVHGLNFKDEVQPKCTSCILGKTVRQPFQTHEEIKTTDKLQLIHMDLCGPMQVQSLANSKYMYVLVDDYTRKIFVYFLKTKDEAFMKFKEFKVQIEKQTNKNIQRIRSDNGGEFINNEFQQYLKENGIIHERTAAYTPQENGISERTNRTLIEMTRCMLQDSKLPNVFWAEAVHYAVYLKNRSLTQKLKITPEEKFTGNKPSVEHIKVFGALTYYWQPKQHRAKLDTTTAEAIFLGYEHNSKHVRIYCTARQQVIIVRDTIIIEEEKGADLLDKTQGNNRVHESQYQTIFMEVPNERNEVNIQQNHNVEENEQINEADSDDDGDEAQIINTDDETVEGEDSEEDEGARDTTGNDPNYQPIYEFNANNDIPRRSERIQTRRNQNIEDNRINVMRNQETPNTYEEAIQITNREQWKAAIREELKSHERNGTWKIIRRPEDKRIIDSKWVFKIKENVDGTINKYKARLVARGYNQMKGQDYDEVFSPVIRLNTLRTILALAVEEDLELYQYDVTTAYLNGILDDEIYMEIPEGVEGNRENSVCKLKRGLYGLKQSAKTWYTTIKEELHKIGFTSLFSEECVFLYRKSSSEYMILCLYVDDILIASTTNDLQNDVMNKIRRKFDMKYIGEPNYLLGWEIKRDKGNKTLSISQEKYINKILTRFNMDMCKGAKIPIEPEKAEETERNEDNKQYPYQELIGSLIYLAQGTRPDIAYATTYLSQFCTNNTKAHWQQAKHVLRYLKQTKTVGITYKRSRNPVKGFSDASWNNNKHDGKGYSGYIFLLADGAISWSCKKQEVVALSTCESEFMAMTEAVKEIIWLKKLMNELKQSKYIGEELILKVDNQAAIKLSSNNITHTKTKHIQRKYFFIRDEIQRKQVKLEYVESREMTADFLTKAVTRATLENCKRKSGMKEMEEKQQ